MSADISLRSLIVDAIESLDLDDPRDIALHVAGVIPEDTIRDHLASALIGEVRSVLSSQRNRALTNALNPDPQPSRSRKVAGIRDWWAEMLASRIHVGGAKWVTLGECGTDELRYAADERRADAAREVARAEAYESLLGLLESHGAATVADLPADAARAVVSGVAA